MTFSKAKESFKAASLCFEQGYTNSATSRAYYAMFQAAQVALSHAGFFRPEWSHAGLQATFANELVRRRKVYSPALARHLNRALELRLTADYSDIEISRRQAAHALEWAEVFLRQVEEVVQHV